MAEVVMMERTIVISMGQRVLLKDVVLAIPTYTMSCFLLLGSLLSKLESLIAKFWWKQCKSERNIYWISWRHMCNSAWL